jgi:hypothetical protein
MDVANNFHLKRNDMGTDVTSEGVAVMRDRAAASLEGKVWTMIASADPSAIGQDFVVVDGKLNKSA